MISILVLPLRLHGLAGGALRGRRARIAQLRRRARARREQHRPLGLRLLVGQYLRRARADRPRIAIHVRRRVGRPEEVAGGVLRAKLIVGAILLPLARRRRFADAGAAARTLVGAPAGHAVRLAGFDARARDRRALLPAGGRAHRAALGAFRGALAIGRRRRRAELRAVVLAFLRA